MNLFGEVRTGGDEFEEREGEELGVWGSESETDVWCSGGDRVQEIHEMHPFGAILVNRFEVL